MGTRISLIALLVVGFGLLCMCGNPEDAPVAKIGDRTITVAEFEQDFSKGKAQNVLEAATDSMKLAHLNSMIDNELLIIDAYRLGFDEDSAIARRVAYTLKDRIARKLWNEEVIANVVTETEVRDLYEKMQKEVRVRDIVLRFTKNDSVNTEPDIKAMIEKIYEYAKGGAAFDSLARRFSQDRATSIKGGDRGFLKWSPTVINNEVYRQAFELEEGEISAPFKSKNEYHILKAEVVRITPLGKYENEKQRLTNRFLSRRRPELDARRKEMLALLMEKANGQFVDENIKLMSDKINGADAIEDSIRKAHHLRPDIFVNLSDEDTAKALYTYGNDLALTIGHIVRTLKEVHPNRRPPLRSEAEIKELVERMMLFELFTYEAKQRGFQNDPDILKEIAKVKEDAMLSKARQEQIEKKINPTDEELMAYYEENKEKYFHPERRDVQEIWITDGDKARAAMRELKSGKSFDTVANKYNERAATLKKSGHLGLIREELYGNIGKTAFKIKKGETSNLIQMGRNYSIVKVLDILEPTQKTFDEVKFQVRNEYRKKRREEVEQEWLERLRNEIKVTIFEDRAYNILKDDVS